MVENPKVQVWVDPPPNPGLWLRVPEPTLPGFGILCFFVCLFCFRIVLGPAHYDRMRTGCVLVVGNLAPCRLACSLEPQVPGSQATTTFGPRKVSRSGRARLVLSVSGSHPNHKIFIYLCLQKEKRKKKFACFGVALWSRRVWLGCFLTRKGGGEGRFFLVCPWWLGWRLMRFLYEASRYRSTYDRATYEY